MDGLQIQWLLDSTMEMETAYNDFIDHYFAPATGPGDQGKGNPAEESR